MTRHEGTEYRGEKLALLALAALKFGLLAIFGPTYEPDWGGYSIIADLILNDTAWITDAGLSQASAPITLFRTIGYPAVVAFFRGMLGTGPAHLYAIIIVQIVASLAVTVLVWRLALALLKSRPLALLAAAGHALSIALLYDQSLLTDSLYNSLFIACWAIPMIGVVERRPAGWKTMALVGLLAGLSCIQRGTGLFFLVFVVPAIAAWIILGARGVTRIVVAAAFILPVAAFVGGTMAWNHARSGYWVISTGAQWVMIQPMFKAAARGHDVFDGDTPIDHLVRKYVKTYEYDEVGTVVNQLFMDYGMNAVDSAALHKQVYLRSWLRHPGAMLENTVNNFEESIIFQFFDVIDNASVYARMITGERLFAGTGKTWKAARQGDVGSMVMLVAVSVLRLVAYASVAVLAVGGLVLGARLVRRRRLDQDEAAILGLWAIFFGYTILLCAIHMVARFLPAVLPAGLIGSLFFAQAIHARLRARSHHG